MFNKGLEMIEARWLFNIPMPQVDVIVHPQSVVHSMVEFVDGSILSQLSTPDMCLPIQYALTWPDRAASDRVQTDFAALGRLDFEAPDLAKFPALGQARRAGEVGGTLRPYSTPQTKSRSMPSVMGTPRSSGSRAWLRGNGSHQVVEHPTLDEIIEADQWARETACDVIGLGQAIA